MSYPYFSVETVDGHRLGRLSVPYSQIADWLNFLNAPHYGAEVISAEQDQHGVQLYFDACEGVYLYLESALGQAWGAPWQTEAPRIASSEVLSKPERTEAIATAA